MLLRFLTPHFSSFVHKLLVKDNTHKPDEARRLWISKAAFEALVSYLDLPPALLSIISNRHQTTSIGYPMTPVRRGAEFDCWFRLPIRALVRCLDSAAIDMNAKESHKKNQMNPYHPLHLEKPDVDIRGFFVLIYLRCGRVPSQLMTLIINFQDGRWGKLIEEPIKHVRTTFESSRKNLETPEPFTIPLVYLGHAVRLWDDVLNSCNDQLIAYASSPGIPRRCRLHVSNINPRKRSYLGKLTIPRTAWGSSIPSSTERSDALRRTCKDMARNCKYCSRLSRR